MFPSILLLAASAVGINYGWEPLPDGGVKYIVQFKLDELEEARNSGKDIESDIPSTVVDVRSISIRLGTSQLPRENPPAKTDLQFPAPNQEIRKPDSAAPANLDAKPGNSALPPPLLQSPQGKPLAAQASFNEPAEKSKTAPDSKSAAASLAIGELAKPWPLIGMLLLLFTSLSGNFYLVWIFAELRKRYRALLVK
jgi:hypothetical protein